EKRPTPEENESNSSRVIQRGWVSFTLAGWVRIQSVLTSTEVHPREVVKRALYFNAAAVILAHNHPSGDTSPSKADKTITQRLVQALQLVDIRVSDHLIVGGTQILSFAEHGLL
ncbi:JAB domain-containing protein, partial [Serratia proteamaculans]|uniref:JAB domain-containing protein n=1 Tax=Serratia proteamaculans TaxID=28151 RepID=UPI0021BD5FBE